LGRHDPALHGGRGIRVAKVWRKSFVAFLEDVGPRPDGTQIERIDNDLGYRPGNCRRASPSDQRHNQTKRMVGPRGHALTDDTVNTGSIWTNPTENGFLITDLLLYAARQQCQR
jgi:hypothetical protein